MKSILNISVSMFPNYQTTGAKRVNLLTWLQSNKWEYEVQNIRKIKDKATRDRLKSQLPAITPSGVFNRRRATGLITHSGFIQFDIDSVNNLETIRQRLTNIDNVAYLGLSVSGRGLWGLIPVSQPERHGEYFQFIEKSFATLGITIDPACKDVCRLRGYSYDPAAYFNHSAIPLNKWFIVEKNKKVIPVSFAAFAALEGPDTRVKVELCINEICTRKIDLTANYRDWFTLGCSIANEFGKEGLGYFHQISQFHHEYDPVDTDKQFSHCLSHRYGITIASFLGLCRDAGIMFKGPLLDFSAYDNNPDFEAYKDSQAKGDKFMVRQPSGSGGPSGVPVELGAYERAAKCKTMIA